MNTQDSFVFYRSWWESIKNLPRESQLDVVAALMDYALDGREGDGLRPITKGWLAMAKPLIDANRARRLNGQKGGAPKGNRNAEKQPRNNLKQPRNNLKQPRNNQKQPNVYVNVNEDNSNELSLSAANAAEARARPSSDLFAQFWAAYPPERRARKAKLAEEWEKRKLDAVAPAIMARLSYDKKTAQWGDVRYVPLAQTWLNAEPWVDFDAKTAREPQKPPPQERLTPVQVQSLRERRFSLISTKRALGELTPTQCAELAAIEKQLSPLSGRG